MGIIVAILSASESAHAQRLLGLDISAHQGVISQTTWNNLRNVENRQFVIIRSSRGGSTGQDNRQGGTFPGGNTTFRLSQRYDDPYFIQNVDRATTAGMFVGTYHRSRADVLAATLGSDGIPAGVDNSGADDAAHMIQMSGPFMRPGYLPPTLDFEDGDGIRSDQAMAQFALDFSNQIYAVMQIRPTIYINGNYANFILGPNGTSPAPANTPAQRSELAQPLNGSPSVLSPAFPTLWVARWPNQTNPNAIDIQNAQPKDSYTEIYGPWDDYGGATHPWAFWQYASTGRLTSYVHASGGSNNLDFDASQGDIEYLKDRLVPAVWWNDSSGDWSTLTNWNSGQPVVTPPPLAGGITPTATGPLPTPRLPGAAGSGPTSGQNDTVILERTNANITVTVSTGTHNVRKLFMREAMNITGGSLTVNYDPNYFSDTATYPNALRSGLVSAQFSGPVTLSGSGALSARTIVVDGNRTFTLSGGTLAINQLVLSPLGTTPAKLVINGDVTINALVGGPSPAILPGPGAGNSPVIDLAGAARVITVGDGALATDLTIYVPVTNGALTKAGAGTLALVAANTYAGNTVVQAGKLSLSMASLANAADVLLSAGATLDLKFTGAPDSIRALVIDGVAKQRGTWGAIGSGAQFTSPLITGTGLLLVAVPEPSATLLLAIAGASLVGTAGRRRCDFAAPGIRP